MKNNIFILFLVFMSTQGIGYTQPLDTLDTWVYDRAPREYLNDISPDQFGNYYLCGYLYSEGEGWYAKVSSEGDIFWEGTYEGDFSAGASVIFPYHDGRSYLGGGVRVGNPFGDSAAYLLRLTPDGEQEWIWTLDNAASDDYTADVVELTDGNLAILGWLAGRPFVATITPEGEERWLRIYDVQGNWWVYDLEPTQDGGMVIAANKGYTFQVIKYSAAGELRWVFSQDDSDARAVKELPNGTLIVGGEDVTGLNDRKLIALTADGHLLWDRLYTDNPTTDRINALAVSPDGHFFAGGGAQDDDYAWRQWVGKFDREGDMLWERFVEWGQVEDMALGADGHLVTIGYDDWYGTPPNSDNLQVVRYEQEVQLDVTPSTTYLPSTGGSVTLDITGTNLLSPLTTYSELGQVYALDRWLTARHPNGMTIPLDISPITLVPGGQVFWPAVTWTVPADLPDGTWTVAAAVGIDTLAPSPNAIPGALGSQSFELIKGFAAVDDPSGPGSSPDNPADDQTAGLLPDAFVLHPAYPNPFNAVTAVTVSLPTPATLTLTVHNLTGQQVATLHNGPVSPGTHTWTFDASALSTGSYFVKAEVSGHLNAVQKVTLMK